MNDPANGTKIIGSVLSIESACTFQEQIFTINMHSVINKERSPFIIPFKNVWDYGDRWLKGQHVH